MEDEQAQRSEGARSALGYIMLERDGEDREKTNGNLVLSMMGSTSNANKQERNPETKTLLGCLRLQRRQFLLNTSEFIPNPNE